VLRKARHTLVQGRGRGGKESPHALAFGARVTRLRLRINDEEAHMCSRWGEESCHAPAFRVRVRIGRREKATWLAPENPTAAP
jgi:hypothetical protein